MNGANRLKLTICKHSAGQWLGHIRPPSGLLGLTAAAGQCCAREEEEEEERQNVMVRVVEDPDQPGVPSCGEGQVGKDGWWENAGGCGRLWEGRRSISGVWGGLHVLPE